MADNQFSVLSDKNALLIFSSQLVSSISDKMMSIGLIWYLTSHYGINIVPWYLVISFLPHLLMAIFSTKLINKFGILKTVVGMQFFRSFILLVLFLFLYLLKIEGDIQLIALFVSSFFVNMATSLFNPAILSLPPELVEDEKVVGLNALIDSCMSISTILGASFAIFVLNLVDLKSLVFINCVSFLLSGLVQLKIKIIKKEILLDSENVHAHPIEVLNKYPKIKRMLASFLFLNFVFAPMFVMIPWYTEKIYLGTSSTMAILEGALGLGAFLSGVYLSIKGHQVQESKRISMISIISFLFGLLFIIFAYSTRVEIGALALFFIGLITTYLNIQVLTYFQTELNSKEVPAIMTAVNIISAAAVPLSLTLSGLIFPHVYIPTFAKFCGVTIVCSSLVMPKYLKGSLWKSESI